MKHNIGRRLIAGFAFCLLTIVVIGVMTLRIARERDTLLAEFYQSHLPGASQLSMAMDGVWQLRYGIVQFMVTDAAEQARIVADEAKWTTLIDKQLAAYAAGHRSAQELQALAALRQSYARYIGARPKWFELYGAGRLAEAAAWRSRTTVPFGAETVFAFEGLIALQQQTVGDELAALQAEIDQTRLQLAGLVALLLASLAMLAMLSWRLLRPIGELRRHSEATLLTLFGETAARNGDDGADEVGALAASFDLLTRRFAAHSDELKRSRDDLSAQAASLELTVTQRTAQLRTQLNQIESSQQESAALYEMGKLLQSCVTLEEVQNITAHFVQRLFAEAQGTLYLVGKSHLTLQELASWNRPPGVQMPTQVKFDQCWGLRRTKPYLSNGTPEAIVCNHLAGREDAVHLCLPLAAHGEIFGLLHLCFAAAGTGPGAGAAVLLPGETLRQHYRVDLAANVAAQIALSLANLKLRENLHMQAVQDVLTGLYNRRYLEDALPRELARAARAGQSLAVFMLDIDHFKNLNDRFGHEAGDAVLQALGLTLRASSRQGDLACRFGGEEFTLILPATELAQARDWGERLLQAVRAMKVQLHDSTLPGVTVSLGLALYPQHGADTATLLQTADLALYEAKHSGRDRLVLASVKATTSETTA